MNSRFESIPLPDGQSFDAYVTGETASPRPVLILLQYICGINKVMRSIAEDYAAQGYLVVVPDLYWRRGARIALIDDPATPDPQEQQRALELNDAFDDEAALLDLRATLSFARQHAGGNGRVGAMGYCLGGRLVWLMAGHTDVDCVVSYYGVNIDRLLNLADQVNRPALLHVAGSDMLVPAGAQDAILQRLRGHPQVAILTHGGVNHAFALLGGANYDVAAAALANHASDAFLQRHLRD